MSKLVSLALMLAAAACTNPELEHINSTKTAMPHHPEPPPPACEVAGCNGTSCAEPGQEALTTCVYKPEFACYRDAKCERQTDGQCGWTRDADLVSCLAEPPPVAGPNDEPPPPPESPIAERDHH